MVDRERYARPEVTLANCSAVKLILEPDGLTQLIVNRHQPYTRAEEPGKKITDLQPGDAVIHIPTGKRHIVKRVEIFS